MANKVYANSEAAIVWEPGGTNAISLTSRANNAGQVGAQVDRGAGARAVRFLWEFRTKCAATPTLGNTISLYLAVAQADATKPSGDVGQADANLSALDKRRNLIFLGVVEIDNAGTGVQAGSGLTCEIPHRYLSLVVVNESGAALSATGTDHKFTLTPIPDELQ